jgi:probable phosphoglycerate mutase
MSETFPVVYLARHGETAWSLSGQHTGLTDLPLTERGQFVAKKLGERLQGLSFAKVYASPLQRAHKTAELAGFGSVAVVDRDLVEWDYGKYEGLKSPEIRAERPDWELFRDGCPGGETLEQISARADRMVAKIREAKGNVLVFSSGHILRVLAARWLGIDPAVVGRYLILDTASVSELGYDRSWMRPVIRLWNDTRHAT